MSGLNQEADSIFDTIRKNYKTLSATNRRIADYVISNYDEVIFISAADLAGRLETSEAAMVRFSQALGFRGFPDFKKELVNYYKEQTTPARKVRNYIDELPSDNEFYSTIINKEIQYLNDSVTTINGDLLWKAVEKLCTAGHRYIYASGVNQGLAHYLTYRLNRFCLRSSAEIYTGKEVFEKLLHFKADDLVIIYGFYQPSQEQRILLSYLHEHGIPNILITDTNVPPMVKHSDLVLYARRGPFGAFHSLLVPMAVTNALIIGVAEHLGNEAMDSLQNLSDLRRAYAYQPLANLDM